MEVVCSKKRKADDESSSISSKRCELVKTKTSKQEALDSFLDGSSRDIVRIKYWKKLSADLKDDPEVVIAAIGCGAVEMEALPTKFLERAFLMLAVSVNSNVWWGLPEQFKKDEEFARAIQDYGVHDYEYLADNVFFFLPSLESNADIWRTIINTNGKCDFEDYSPPAEILADRDLMEKTCSINPKAVSYINAAFLQDGTFVVTLLEKCPSAAQFLPYDEQTRFQDLVANAFLNGGAEGLMDQYAPELRENRSVVKAWFQGGGELSHWCPMEWKSDKEICLLIAGQSKTSKCDLSSDLVRRRSIQSFSYASEKLRNNKQFMLQAIQLQPYLFRNAGSNVKRDFDLALMAFANCREFAAAYYSVSLPGDEAFAELVLSQVREELTVQETFINTVACNISLRRGGLAMLNQGNEMTNEFKLRLANLLGVPRGVTLDLYRRACENLETVI